MIVLQGHSNLYEKKNTLACICNILWELGQNHGCWWLGSLGHNSHAIDLVE